MALSLLITGTDTEVGKTFIAAGLIRALARMGLRVAPFKPVETGCVRDGSTGQLIPADARLLQSASGTTARLSTVCPYQFSLPAAPWVAAEKEHLSIDLSVLDRALEQLRAIHDCVLIESAGGLLVPLAPGVDFADLAVRWRVPVLVVAGSRLGVLNQTLLTTRVLEHADIPVAGVVLNHPYGDSQKTSLGAIHLPALDTNAQVLRQMLRCPFWEVPSAHSHAVDEFDDIFNELADQLIRSLRGWA